MSQINTGEVQSDFEKLPGLTFDQGESTGFSQNMTAAFKLIQNNDSSMSIFRNRGMYNDRDKQIQGYLENGQIPGKIANSYRGDYGAVAMWARLNVPGLKIPTDEELDAQRDELIAKENASAQKVFKDQSLSGKAGQIGGAIVSTLFDPAYIPTYAVGGISAAAKGVQVLKAMGAIAGVEAAAETVKQFSVYNHKADIGVDYNVRDAVQEILISTAFAGGAEGAFLAGRKYLKSLKGDAAVEQIDEFLTKYTTGTPEADAAVKDIKNVRDMLKHAGTDNAEDYLVKASETEVVVNEVGPRNTTPYAEVTPDGTEIPTTFETLYEARKAEDPVKAQSFDSATAKAESDISNFDEIIKDCA